MLSIRASGGMIRMKKNYERIMNSERVSASDKKYLQDNQNKWEVAVDRKCNDNVCYYHAIAQRNDDMQTFMQNRGLQPM
ncbi:hypothetical protein D9M68_109640 [compost metagenome]